LRQGQQRDANKKWGSYTQEEAKNYYEKLGIKCCELATYQRWFTLAERCQSKCRTLKSFCQDCRPEYEEAMRACDCCIKPAESHKSAG